MEKGANALSTATGSVLPQIPVGGMSGTDDPQIQRTLSGSGWAKGLQLGDPALPVRYITFLPCKMSETDLALGGSRKQGWQNLQSDC